MSKKKGKAMQQDDDIPVDPGPPADVPAEPEPSVEELRADALIANLRHLKRGGTLTAEVINELMEVIKPGSSEVETVQRVKRL